MSTEDELIILSHTQYVGRHFIALRCSGEKLAELIGYSIGAAAPPADQILLFLRRESTQKTLERDWETALWVSADRTKSWRLICLATTADPAVAKRLLAKRPPSADCCAHCWQEERGYPDQLVPELDVYGERVPGIYLHRACVRPRKLLRDLVAREHSHAQ